MKKINITQDVESRRRIAGQQIPAASMELQKTKTQDAESSQIQGSEENAGGEQPQAPKKGRRKATGDA